MPIKAILFDLGGVLVDWDGIKPLVRLTNSKITPEKARQFWLESSWVRRFETGFCSKNEFALGVVKELDLTITSGEFIKEFSGWDRGPFKGANELLENLQKDFLLYCLSNNNTIHWHHPGIQEIIRYFVKTFVSFETGFMKPDPSAFKWALDHIPESPDRILFLDDNKECVESATNLGLIARQAKGLEGVRKVLSEFS